MLYTIKNVAAEVKIESLGAELQSFKGSGGTEFLWNGDPEFWASRAPNLFPIVGRLVNGAYRVGGREFKLGGHGFAREKEFSVVSRGEDSIAFELSSDDETRAVYPYDFSFVVDYRLNKNILAVRFEIKNRGDGAMHFGVGAHPGFMCPIESGEKFSDYYLEFSEPETAELLTVRPDGFFGHETKPFLSNEKIINLEHGLFVPDALVFKGLKSNEISLKSKNHGKHVRVRFDGFEYLGIWTKVGAPYVCIEPWTSLGDYFDFTGEFEKKPGIARLEKRQIFTVTHEIGVFE